MKTFILNNTLYIGAVLIAFFSPIKGLLFCTGFFLVADFLTGIWAAYKRGEQIQSKKMGHTVTKLLLYSLAIILGQLLSNQIAIGIPIAKITASIICLVEFKSILENIKFITGLDIWSILKDKLNERKL